MEILSVPIPDFIRKRVKVLLDVTVERLGDGAAAFLILFYTFFLGGSDVTLLSYFSLGLIVIWASVVFIVQGGYLEALRRSLTYREISLDETRIDYADKRTVAAVLKTLEEKEEQSVLFGLELAEKLDPKSRCASAVARPAPPLLSGGQEPSHQTFFATPGPCYPKRNNPDAAGQKWRGPGGGDQRGWSHFQEGCDTDYPPVSRKLQLPRQKGGFLECLLRYGDGDTRAAASSAFLEMITDRSAEGEKSRVEAARLAGEVDDPEFPAHLFRLIRDDPSYPVVHAAMAAAGRKKYPAAVQDIIARFGDNATKVEAREALIQYGEIAVEGFTACPLRSPCSP